MFNYSERPYRVEPKCIYNGEAIYEIGPYQVRFEYLDGSAHYWKPYSRPSSDPRRTLPNMDIADGVITIPIEDLTSAVLAKLTPEEVARELWKDQDVRNALVDALIRDYHTDALGDDARRRLLHGVKEKIHDRLLQQTAGEMGSLEQAWATKWRHFDYLHSLNSQLYTLETQLRDRLEAGQLTAADIKLPRYSTHDTDKDFKIGGTIWNEAREHWRQELTARFPKPEEPTDGQDAKDEIAF